MKKYIEASADAGKQFYLDFHNKGKIVMLNLLKFKPLADYSNFESLQPEQPVTGEEAYQMYIEHTLPHLKQAGGQVKFIGKSGKFLIGPEAENWDLVLLVEHQSVAKFMEFAQNEDYLKGVGHRSAALEDSRLLPITEHGIDSDV